MDGTDLARRLTLFQQPTVMAFDTKYSFAILYLASQVGEETETKFTEFLWMLIG